MTGENFREFLKNVILPENKWFFWYGCTRYGLPDCRCSLGGRAVARIRVKQARLFWFPAAGSGRIQRVFSRYHCIVGLCAISNR